MSLNPRPTRSEQREAARAKARELREQRAKGESRRRVLIFSSISILVAVVIAGVSWAVISFSEDSKIKAENAKKVPANISTQGGILIGKDLQIVSEAEARKTNHIVIYQDYQCPICQVFESPNAAQLRTWAGSGLAVVEIHPISFLDGASLNNYSSRATNAALCVVNSQPENFFDVNTALYANQPAENTSGPSDAQLKDTLKYNGVTMDDEMNTCIDQKRYETYINNITAASFQENAVTGNTKVGGTPHILVNGNLYDWEGSLANLGNPGRFSQFFTVHQKSN